MTMGRRPESCPIWVPEATEIMLGGLPQQQMMMHHGEIQITHSKYEAYISLSCERKDSKHMYLHR